MKPSLFRSTLTYFLCFSTCLSLCAEAPKVTPIEKENIPEITSESSQDNSDANTIDEEIILGSKGDIYEATDEDAQIEEDSASTNTTRVLYDPKMNYGTGATPETKPRISSKMRSVYAAIASTVLAVVGMLVTSSNSGKDAPK